MYKCANLFVYPKPNAKSDEEVEEIIINLHILHGTPQTSSFSLFR